MDGWIAGSSNAAKHNFMEENNEQCEWFKSGSCHPDGDISSQPHSRSSKITILPPFQQSKP
jgi:hypothetical protein